MHAGRVRAGPAVRGAERGRLLASLVIDRSGRARIAMELDINPERVQLDVAGRPGGPLRAAIRGQARPANQFLLGWARDFIAVLAPAGAGR